MSFASAHLNFAGAQESFLSSKNNTSTHLDLADFISVPKLSTIKNHLEEYSHVESLSKNMRYALESIAYLIPGDEENSSHPSVGTFSYNWIATTDYNVGMSVILQADVALGVHMPLFSVYTDRHNIAFNP